MAKGPIEAQGLDTKVVVTDDKVLVQHRGLLSVLRQGATLYKDPDALAGAFEGPSRHVLLQALSENRGLANALLNAAREGNGAPEGDNRPSAQALAVAFHTKRQLVLRALRDNDGLVKQWIKDHKDLLGIFLKGDVHAYRSDVQTADLGPLRNGEGCLLLTISDTVFKVRFGEDQLASFEALHRLLTTQSQVAEPATIAPAAATKPCPMCAEDVKAAAKLCRFCGHRFDVQA